MRVLVLGGGGREQALVWACRRTGHDVRLAADLGDAVLDGEVFVGAPRQPVLDIAQHRRDRGAHIAVT